jgi:hypothetical protein
MLRRYEIYSVDPSLTEGIAKLRQALLDTAAYIPEMFHSAVGDNLTDAPVQLAWEHAYESAEAYRRYMVHPYHASVLDRYLLTDAPERVITNNDSGLGLVGFSCEPGEYYLPSGLRRLIALNMGSASAGEVDDVAAMVGEAKGLATSIFSPNSFGACWYDGENPTGPPPEWTHLWEQGFTGEAELNAYLGAGNAAADAERDWSKVPGVTTFTTVCYAIEPGWGYTASG